MSVSLPEMVEALERKAAPLLIIDDDPDSRDALANSLVQEGFAILQATNPVEGLDILSNHIVSVIITHHKLHGTSGIDFLNQARECKPATQRVLISYEPLQDHLLKLMQPFQLVIDPYDRDIFINVIEECFNRFRMQFEHQAMQSILHKHHKSLDQVHSKERQELDLSSKIQKAFLIDISPEQMPGITIHSHVTPSKDIDGDFNAFYRPTHEIMDFALGDVMGKGATAALIGTVVRGEISHYAEFLKNSFFEYDNLTFWHENIPTIKEVMQKLHRAIVDRLVSLDYFVSLLYGRLDLHKRTLSFIDCGYTKPIYYRSKSKKAVCIESTNFPLGTVKEHEYAAFEVLYEEGDFFLFYSDAVIEAKSLQGELFGEKKLVQLVEKYGQLNADELLARIKQALIDFTSQTVLDDDLTLLVLKIDEYAEPKKNQSGVGKFNSSLTQLEAVRAWTRECCSKAPGAGIELGTLLQLVVDEVFTNIVLHGYEAKAGSPICIRAEYLKDMLMLEISDQGQPLNPIEIPTINLYGDREHGYGWYLIRQIADKVIYQPKQTTNGWNHLRIYKNYNPKKEVSMEITTTEKNGLLLIRLDSPSLDAKAVPEFKEKVMQKINEKNLNRVIFDLQKLQFIDSSGLGAFLSLLRQLNTRGGHLALASMNPPVKSIFELVSMQKIFECHDTLDNAINAQVKTKTR